MIDETTLVGLRRDDMAPPIPFRPLDEVLARGDHVRRRRQVRRSAAAGLVAAGVVLGAVLVVNHRSSEPSPDVVNDSTTTTPAPSTTATTKPTPSTTDARSVAPPAEPACADAKASPTKLGPADVPDELRMLPAWMPEGAVATAEGTHWADPCPGSAALPAEDALVLRSSDAEIVVQGPRPWPLHIQGYPSTPTITLRGQKAAIVTAYRTTPLDTRVEWTEPDGWSWLVLARGVEDELLLSVLTALHLDSSPEGEEPPAALDPEDLPAGFQVAWQQHGVATAQPRERTTWDVVVTQPGGSGDRCEIEVEHHAGRQPVPQTILRTLAGGPVGQPTSVDGKPAVAVPWSSTKAEVLGLALAWDLSPGVRAVVVCARTDDLQVPEVTRRLAESLETVGVDDHRLLG